MQRQLEEQGGDAVSGYLLLINPFRCTCGLAHKVSFGEPIFVILKIATVLFNMVRLLLLLFVLGCSAPKPVPSATSDVSSTGIILTIIFKIDPKLDTLTVFDIIRGPGRLRTDYGAAAENGPEELLFTYLGASGNTLRQTAKPYPNPNRYEGPGDNGELQTVEMPAESRSLVLKTQASRRLRWLLVSGVLPSGVRLSQRIDIQQRK